MHEMSGWENMKNISQMSSVEILSNLLGIKSCVAMFQVSRICQRTDARSL